MSRRARAAAGRIAPMNDLSRRHFNRVIGAAAVVGFAAGFVIACVLFAISALLGIGGVDCTP